MAITAGSPTEPWWKSSGKRRGVATTKKASGEVAEHSREMGSFMGGA